MTTEENAVFEQRLTELEKQMVVLSRVMLGELSEPEKTGMLHQHMRLLHDLYGKDGKEGAFERLNRLELEHEREKSWLKGASFVSAAVGGLVVFVIEMFLKTVLK